MSCARHGHTRQTTCYGLRGLRLGESELAVECASEEGRDTTQKLGYIIVNGCGSFVGFPRQHVAGAKRAVNLTRGRHNAFWHCGAAPTQSFNCAGLIDEASLCAFGGNLLGQKFFQSSRSSSVPAVALQLPIPSFPRGYSYLSSPFP